MKRLVKAAAIIVAVMAVIVLILFCLNLRDGWDMLGYAMLFYIAFRILEVILAILLAVILVLYFYRGYKSGTIKNLRLKVFAVASAALICYIFPLAINSPQTVNGKVVFARLIQNYGENGHGGGWVCRTTIYTDGTVERYEEKWSEYADIKHQISQPVEFSLDEQENTALRRSLNKLDKLDANSISVRTDFDGEDEAVAFSRTEVVYGARLFGDTIIHSFDGCERCLAVKETEELIEGFYEHKAED